jgi:hypothetical protein
MVLDIPETSCNVIKIMERIPRDGGDPGLVEIFFGGEKKVPKFT